MSSSTHCATQQVLQPTGVPLRLRGAEPHRHLPTWSIATLPDRHARAGRRALAHRRPPRPSAHIERRHPLALRRLAPARRRRRPVQPHRLDRCPARRLRVDPRWPRPRAVDPRARVSGSRAAVPRRRARRASRCTRRARSSPTRSTVASRRRCTRSSLRLHWIATVMARISVGISPIDHATPPPMYWSSKGRRRPRCDPSSRTSRRRISPDCIMIAMPKNACIAITAMSGDQATGVRQPVGHGVDADQRLHEQVAGDQEVRDHPLVARGGRTATSGTRSV